MADADWEFIFDGVIGFLSSPIWQIPIMSYIENNCVVFDPSEENCLSWSDLHKQYGSLVEDLLSSYLQDVGITEEQFFKACGSENLGSRPQMQLVFEQIWAAEDFEVFKRMMVQKNIELELQALHLIQQRQGVQQPQQKKQEPERAALDEDEILKIVMQKSKEEYEAAQGQKSKVESNYDKELETSLAKSKDDVKLLEDVAEKKRQEMKEVVTSSIAETKTEALKEEAPKVEATKADKPSTPSKEKPPAASSSPAKKPAAAVSPKKEAPKKAKPVEKSVPEPVKSGALPPISTTRPKSAQEAAASWLSSAKAEAEASTGIGKSGSVNTSSGTDDMKRREEYLRQQRDKLLTMKKQEREKRLDIYSANQPKRPTSARVARRAVTEEETGKQEAHSETVDDPKKLAMRKALADRLKKEVLYK